MHKTKNKKPQGLLNVSLNLDRDFIAFHCSLDFSIFPVQCPLKNNLKTQKQKKLNNNNYFQKEI